MFSSNREPRFQHTGTHHDTERDNTHEQQRSGGAGYEKSGLDLTSYAGVMKGTKFGRMVIPRDPKQQFNVVAGLARRRHLPVAFLC
jgi:hypothetical protein